MADVNKSSDLITTLNDTETRLKKLERQLAVPRRGASSIVAAATAVPGDGKKLLSDTVTVVTTASCLIHFYVECELKWSSSTFENGKVHIRDMEVGASADLMIISDGASATGTVPTTYQKYGTQQGIPINAASFYQTQRPGPFGPISITNNASWAKAAGSHTFNLVAECPTIQMSIQKRKFFAWVQPF